MRSIHLGNSNKKLLVTRASLLLDLISKKLLYSSSWHYYLEQNATRASTARCQTSRASSSESKAPTRPCFGALVLLKKWNHSTQDGWCPKWSSSWILTWSSPQRSYEVMWVDGRSRCSSCILGGHWQSQSLHLWQKDRFILASLSDPLLAMLEPRHFWRVLILRVQRLSWSKPEHTWSGAGQLADWRLGVVLFA